MASLVRQRLTNCGRRSARPEERNSDQDHDLIRTRCRQKRTAHERGIRPVTAVPTTVFTIPELNRVGVLEHEARDSGLDNDLRFNDTSGWYSNFRVGETTASAKIIIERATDRILGAHLRGPGYAELINIFGLAIKLGLTSRQLKSMTATYPSIGSDLGSML